MAASHETVAQIVEVVKKHVGKRTLEYIVIDLLKVDGNQSFRDTIQRMADRLGIRTK